MVQDMEICKILKLVILIAILTKPITSKATNNLRDIKISAADFALLKYQTFLDKNFDRLSNTRVFPSTIIFYEYVYSTVKYTEENTFFIQIFAYMNRERYTNKIKYNPKTKDCNTVRNKIFLNKIGYNFLTQKKNNLISKNDLTDVILRNILNISGINEDDKIKIINETQIEINIIHPNNINSIKCSGRINQVELY